MQQGVALGVLLALLALPAAAGSAAEDSDAKKRPKPRPLCLGKRATIVGTARQNADQRHAPRST